MISNPLQVHKLIRNEIFFSIIDEIGKKKAQPPKLGGCAGRFEPRTGGLGVQNQLAAAIFELFTHFQADGVVDSL